MDSPHRVCSRPSWRSPCWPRCHGRRRPCRARDEPSRTSGATVDGPGEVVTDRSAEAHRRATADLDVQDASGGDRRVRRHRPGRRSSADRPTRVTGSTPGTFDVDSTTIAAQDGDSDRTTVELHGRGSGAEPSPPAARPPHPAAHRRAQRRRRAPPTSAGVPLRAPSPSDGRERRPRMTRRHPADHRRAGDRHRRRGVPARAAAAAPGASA